MASTKKAGTHRSKIVESLQDACDLESGSRDQFEHARKGRLASQLSLVKSMISSSLVSGGKQSTSKAAPQAEPGMMGLRSGECCVSVTLHSFVRVKPCAEPDRRNISLTSLNRSLNSTKDSL